MSPRLSTIRSSARAAAIWNIDHPERSDFQMVAAPYVCPGETLPKKAAPALGQDTERLLTECGLSHEHVADLRQRGVI